MKKLRRIGCLMLALVVMLMFAAPAFAANITVENAVADETYDAYRIFDVTNSGANYAYTISGSSPWKSVVDDFQFNFGTGNEKVFTCTPTASNADEYIVTVNSAFTEDDSTAVKAFADTLATYLRNHETEVAATKTTASEVDGQVKFTDLAQGYYFVNTSMGALCALETATDAQTVKEKNSSPDLKKEVQDEDDWTDRTSASIGDDVTFRLTVTDGVGTNQAIVVHDKMSAGLTLKPESFVVQHNNENVDAANYTVKTTGLTDECTFEIEFTAAYVGTLDTNAEIVITYAATLNEKAVIAGEGNSNNAQLTYSNQTTTDKTAKVYTYTFDLVKTNESGEVLTGAKFKLYDNQTKGNLIPVVQEENGDYHVATAEEKAAGGESFEGDVIEAGRPTIKGLGNGTYWLEEIEAPQGYNKLTERKSFTIEDKNLDATVDTDAATSKDVWSEGGVNVVNKTGTELPSTGGIGTTIFYVIGSILVIGAGVLLVAKKRMAHNV